MYYSLNFKPYTELWVNCNFNMLISILTSKESSYYMLPYINDYLYEIPEMDTPIKKVKYLTLTSCVNTSTKYINNLFSLSYPINFKHEKNGFDLVKGLIMQGEIVEIGVDLFYWIPKSICWNKHHWEHYSLINGFNDTKRVIYVFDDTYKGYDEHEIPVERFLHAVYKCSLEPHAYVHHLIDNICKFEIDLNDIAFNAEQLIKNLNTIDIFSMWNLEYTDFEDERMRGLYSMGNMFDLFPMYITQIINRHKGNKKLFEILYKYGYIKNEDLKQTLLSICADLENEWLLIRNKLYKKFRSQMVELNINEIYELINLSLKKELDMWNTLLIHI